MTHAGENSHQIKKRSQIQAKYREKVKKDPIKYAAVLEKDRE